MLFVAKVDETVVGMQLLAAGCVTGKSSCIGPLCGLFETMGVKPVGPAAPLAPPPGFDTGTGTRNCPLEVFISRYFLFGARPPPLWLLAPALAVGCLVGWKIGGLVGPVG